MLGLYDSTTQLSPILNAFCLLPLKFTKSFKPAVSHNIALNIKEYGLTAVF